jgi:vacuolar-type H+-ATPase subunit F/Vma7
MDPVQIIGDADTVLAFSLGGVPGCVVATADEARAAVEAAVQQVRRDGGPARRPLLLLVTYATAARIRTYLDRVLLDASGPLVVEIPGVGEPARRSPAEVFVARVLGVQL